MTVEMLCWIALAICIVVAIVAGFALRASGNASTMAYWEEEDDTVYWE